ncbi:YlbL family protein [Corynebacterium epidermidicanis]|nr:PDZ domain-containing protein [Corynebacterium epidermidicanis]
MTYLATAPTVPFTSIPLTVPYAAESPGPTFNTLAEFEGKPIVAVTGTETDPTSGNLNMTTVSVYSQLTFAQALSRWLVHDDTLVPIEQIFPPNLSQTEVDHQNKVQFSQSESAATLAALEYLERPTAVEVVDIVPDSAAQSILMPGDRIVAFAGQPITEPSQVREKVLAGQPGDTVELSVVGAQATPETQPETKTLTLGKNPDTGNAFLGITMGAVAADGTKVEYNLKDIGGPSAGMMFSLAVVDKLSPGELTGGKFVAGTGTIEENGTVGPIGGIKHKVQAAADAGAEVFLAPSANCAEAMSKTHEGLTVLKVDTLAQAIDQLNAYNSGGEVVRCEK